MFVAVLAIWAAYLLQHWVRRREYLATARSVDRYSEAMRVLERRTPVLTNDAAPRQHPALLSRPQVTVVPASAEPAVRTPGDPVVTSAKTQTPAVGLSRGVARAVKVARMRPRSVPAPVRGLAFLVALVGLPVLLVLSVLGRTPWSAVLLDVVALGLVVVWLRRAAVARRKARRGGAATRSAARPAARPAAMPATRPAAMPAARPVQKQAANRPRAGSPARSARPSNPSRSSRTSRPARQAPAASQAPAAPEARPAQGAPLGSTTEQVAAAGPDPARRQALIDEATQPIPVADLPQETPAAGTWSPVYVPPPTYTLKDMAHRPPPAPIEEPVEQIEVEPEVQRLADAVRRAVNG